MKSYDYIEGGTQNGMVEKVKRSHRLHRKQFRR